MKKNIMIALLAIALVVSVAYQATADYTMTHEQPITIYMREGLQEDDIYIPEGHGQKFDIVPVKGDKW